MTIVKGKTVIGLTILALVSSLFLSSCSSVASGVKSNLGATITDKHVLLAKLKNKKGIFDTSALNLASSALRNDKPVVLAAVKQDGTALEFASASLKNDKQIALTACKQDGSALEFVSRHLKTDRQVVLAAVKESGYQLKYAAPSLKKDKQIALTAAMDSRQAIKYFDASLLRDKAFMQQIKSLPR